MTSQIPRESTVVSAVLKRLRTAGGLFEKQHGNAFTRIGTADIIGCLWGYYVAIECKRPGGKTSKAQDRFLDEVRRAGGFAYVVDDAQQVGSIIEEIRAHNRRPPCLGSRA